MFKLVIQDDEGKTTVVPLIRDEITIGRKEGNTIRLTERNVSRRHARIVRANGAVAIEDLGSYNGVRVNGSRIAARTSLSVSDRVQIGDYLIELKAEGVEAVDDGKTQPVERMDAAAIEAQIAQANTLPAPRPAIAAPQDVSDGAKTAPMTMASPTAQGRLVVLSSNFAGLVLPLTQAQMIIGRTDDSDLVVNHSSISRNHARIARDATSGTYSISDLQSSNGVRVNGEDVAKVELRRGDVVDLGQVRLRFVEAGEEFVFNRAVHISDVPGGGKSKGLLFAGIGLALAAAGVIGVMAMKKGDSKKPTVAEGTGTAGTAGTGTPIVVANTLPDAAPAGAGSSGSSGSSGVGEPMVAPSALASELAAKLTECRTLRDEKKWIDVVSCAKAARAIDAQSAEATTLSEQAVLEKENEFHHDNVADAARKKDYARLYAEYSKIDPTSVYKEPARALNDKFRDQYQAERVTLAKTKARANACKDIAKMAEQDRATRWPEVADAVAAVPCTEKVASNEPPKNPTNPDVPKNPTNPDPPKVECDAKALLSDAAKAVSSSAWAQVAQKADAVLRCERNNSQALRYALIAACEMKDRGRAASLLQRISSSQRASMIGRCATAGIDLTQ